MSCAHHLANHPDKFDVTLIDAVDYCGGQAFSIPLDKSRFGASFLNQGVQGGSYIFHHTLTMFARQGYHADPVKLQVSFGRDETFWTNVFPTQLLADHQKEIARFVWMLKVVRWFELLFAVLPIKYLMKLFHFSSFFVNTVAMPMVALFLGTGNYTPEVPSMILERLCTSPTYGMWYPPDKHSIASNLPPMVVFPNFSEFYETWRQDLIRRGVIVRLSTELTRVLSRSKNGVLVRTIKRTPVKDTHNPDSMWADGDQRSKVDSNAQEVEEHYDELILCVLADTAKRILDRTATWRERKILGSAKFANDITITHWDTEYMRKHYTADWETGSAKAVSSLGGTDQRGRIEKAKRDFKPMYLIKTYPSDRSKLEMCFDCSNYQAQFSPDLPFDKHVFQTIFLNHERDSRLWDLDQIAEDKIVRKDWWHQLCHSWTHYAFVVPWLWTIQGFEKSLHTRFAGSWTLVNAHEIACISGIAAAVSLGAEYPADLERDRFALLAFRLYYLFMYRTWYRRKYTEKNREGEGSSWASGIYGSVYCGPGVVKEERLTWREEREASRSL